MPILQAFFTNFSLETIYLSQELREKWPYLQNQHSKKNSTQCIILFLFLWFSDNKNIITKVYLPLIITKVKVILIDKISGQLRIRFLIEVYLRLRIRSVLNRIRNSGYMVNNNSAGVRLSILLGLVAYSNFALQESVKEPLLKTTFHHCFSFSFSVFF